MRKAPVPLQIEYAASAVDAPATPAANADDDDLVGQNRKHARMSQRQLPIILALGTTQTLAWASSYYLPALLADPMARDLGISTPIANEASIALGTSTGSLLELTAAYAAVAADAYPVQPRGLEDVAEKPWYSTLTEGQGKMPRRVHDGLMELLAAAANDGTPGVTV